MSLRKIRSDRAFYIFNLLQTTFQKSYSKMRKDGWGQIEIPASLQKHVFKDVLNHYAQHIRRYGVDVSDVCPYKILAWSGYILAQRLYVLGNKESETMAIQCISSAILAMLQLLSVESKTIEESFHKKALNMVFTEIKGIRSRTDTQFGLGMNGFYMMFRTASVCMELNDT